MKENFSIPAETEELINRLQCLKEEEYDLLSRQLHDVLGQDLTCLKMSAHRLYKNAHVSETPVLKEEIRELISMINYIMGSVREIATDVQPRVLKEFGLVIAIQSLLFDLRLNSEFEYKFVNRTKKISVNPNFTSDILKICKAILSKTSGALVTITSDEKSVSIIIKDEVTQKRDNEWMGKNLSFFKSLQDRAMLFGGNVKITSDEGDGFIASVIIPVKL